MGGSLLTPFLMHNFHFISSVRILSIRHVHSLHNSIFSKGTSIKYEFVYASPKLRTFSPLKLSGRIFSAELSLSLSISYPPVLDRFVPSTKYFSNSFFPTLRFFLFFSIFELEIFPHKI